MKLYALKIRKSDLDLLTLLNSGVTPEIEKKPTWLLFSVDGKNHTTKIVTLDELAVASPNGFNEYGACLLTIKK